MWTSWARSWTGLVVEIGARLWPGADAHSSGQGQAVRIERGGDRLEEGLAAGLAVAAAARGEADGGAAVVHRAAAVAGLGADVGVDQAADGAFVVVHRGVEAGDGAGVH